MTETGHHTVRWTGWDRAGAGCGAAYVLLILVGNQLGGSGSDPHPTGRADLADFSATPHLVDEVGFGMEVLGMLCFLFFLGWFVSLLRSRGGAASWLAATAGYAGLLTLAVKLASVMPMTAGILDHAQLSPTLARVLSDMNGAAFVVTFLPFGTFLLATGLAILAGGTLGRVAGWSAVLIGAAGIGLTLATHVDPVTSNPVPFLLGLLWLLVTGVRLAVRAPRGAAGTRSGADLRPGLAPTA